MLQALTESECVAAGLNIAATPLGATYEGEAGTFLVWAPAVRQMEVHVVAPRERRIPMERAGDGYFYAVDFESKPGTRYFYTLDASKDRPDPASRAQPEGVHGPSQIVTRSGSGPR